MKQSKGRRDDADRLNDMLLAIERMEHYRVLFDNGHLDEQLIHDAILYNLAVIGEATNAISEETLGEEVDIPWRSIVGLRNLIIHQYFHVSMERIWEVLDLNMPDLKVAIQRLLNIQ